MDMNKVYVIIVTYNGMKWIDECLKSVYNSSLPVEIILIDNCSGDETVSLVKSKFTEVVLIEQRENLGFGKANNVGMLFALQNEADFVFLLNQDTLILEHTIENLIKIAIKKPNYGILSPIQLDYSGEFLEHYFFNFMGQDLSKRFYSDFVLGNSIKEIYDIDFIQAAAWLLPISTVKKIGGFDPIFFHYGEDDNYCQRALYHNLKIGVVPSAYIKHDSFVGEKPTPGLFTKEYFFNYQKKLYVNYANLNRPFTQLQIKKEKTVIYKMMIISICTLNYFKTKGLFKKYKIFHDSVIKIEESRAVNSIIRTNYL